MRHPLPKRVAAISPRQNIRVARFWVSLLLISMNLVLLVGIGAHYSARAATSVVTNLDDSGPGSLRQAIADATPADTITFAVSGTIVLTSAELVVDKDLTLSGPGATSLSISGNRANLAGGKRVINNSAHLTISGLTIRDGTTVGFDHGGGILNQSTGVLTITNSMLVENLGYQGGAVYNSPGGVVQIADSTIENNVTVAAVDGNGGGIYGAGPGGNIRIVGSTFIHNTSEDSGAALFNENGSSVSVVNSTFFFNQSHSGAIGNLGTLALNNVTVSVNNGDKLTGALRAYKNSNTTIQNSIIARNLGGFPDCDGQISSGGHNLIGYDNGCGFSAGLGDLAGNAQQPIDPALGTLQDNGGPTLTMLPQAGSPAIDAGSPAAPGSGNGACEAIDQRGGARPTFGASSATCDIGAVEIGGISQPQPAAPAIEQITPASASPGTSVAITGIGLSTTSAVSFNGVPASSFTVLDDATLSAVVPPGATSGPISVTAAGGTASSGGFSIRQPCTVIVRIPALAGGQSYWVQLASHADGPIDVSWAQPIAGRPQLMLYADNPFAGLANPVSRGRVGKPIAQQEATNANDLGITVPVQPAGIYTVQFFNAGKPVGESTGTLHYTNDGTPCPTAS